MVIEEVIKALEDTFRGKYPDVIFILHKTVEPCKLPAFKKSIYTLVYKVNATAETEPLLTVSRVDKVTSEQESIEVERRVRQEFMYQLFSNYDRLRDRVSDTNK